MKRKMIKKTISIVLSLIILSSAISLPAYAALIEQATYKGILNADLQGEHNKNVQQLTNKTDTGNDQVDITNNQAKVNYKQNVDQDTLDYKTERFIVKYADEQVAPQFSNGGEKTDNLDKGNSQAANEELPIDSNKITSAGIESAEKIDGVNSGSLTVFETNTPMNQADFITAIETAGLDYNIEYIQPDFSMTISADPLLTQQWGLSETTTDSGIMTSVGTDVVNAWSNSQGNGILIAVLDSGIDLQQPDLINNFYTNINDIPDNGIDDDGNGYIDDTYGWDFYNNDKSVNDQENYYDQWHGTHVAGIIAAQKDNDIGVAGVAPNAKILPIKIFQDGVAYTSDIINAIAYAESMGAKVINCSWGSRFSNPALEEAITNSSALFVCATGNNLYNNDNYPVYPASYSTAHNNVISVAAIDQSGKLCRFSNYGPTSVNIAAPGKNILSTWINEEYQSLEGTSMSAAFVSGAAALVYAKGTYTTAETVRERLISSADSVTGLQDKINDGKILNCAYATSDNPDVNTNVIDVQDFEGLPIIIPNTEPSQDDYQQSNAENYIVEKASMSTSRVGLQAVTLNGKIYAIGGQNSNGYLNTVEIYDPNTNTWTASANLNIARANFSAVVYNGKIYVMGGKNSGGYINSIECYDPMTNVWTTMSTTLPVAMSSFSATIYGSNIYIIGGFNGSYKSSVYEYNIGTSTWTPKASLSVPISNHVAFYYNDMIYIEGGQTTGGVYTYNEYKYALASGTTSSAVWARSAISNAAGIVANDRFISLGGVNSSYSYSTDVTQSSLLVNNTTTRGYYISASHMLSARGGLGATLLDGKVYIVGGMNAYGVLSSVEMMDLGWEETSKLGASITDSQTGETQYSHINLSNFEFVELDGKIYAMGGQCETLPNGTVLQKTQSVYVYDTVSNHWSINDNAMPVYAQNFSLTSAYGKIYLFGGETTPDQSGAYSISNSIYEYEPSTNTWILKTTMSIARRNVSTVLFNGKIFITGGIDSNGNSTDLVETYDPLTNEITTNTVLPDSLSNHFSCVVNNILYVFSSTQLFKYIDSSDSWNDLTPSGSMSGNVFASLNGSVYCFGNGNDTTAPINPTFYKYLPADNMWTYYQTFNYYGVFDKVLNINNSVYAFTKPTLGTLGTSFVKYTPPATAWSDKADMNTPRYYSGAAVLNDEIYNTGGCNDQQYKWEKWSTNQNYYPGTYSMTESFWVDGGTAPSGMTISGYTGFSFDPYTGLYSPAGSYVTYSLAYPGVLYWQFGSSLRSQNIQWDNTWNIWGKEVTGPTGGYTYYTQGSTNLGYVDGAQGAYPNNSYQYDPSTGNYFWYVFVGANALNTLEKFNETSNTWTSLTGMTYPRYGLGVAEANGKLYAIGGTSNLTVNSYVEEYNPSTNAWITKAAIPSATTDMAIASYNGIIYIFGGKNSSGNVLNTVRAFNPSANSWETKALMPTATFGSGAAVIDGKIYIAGGFTNSTNVTAVLQVYDPGTNSWDTTKASLPLALGYAGVAASSDTLYAIGGTNGTSDLNYALQYNPTTNKWLSWEGPNKIRNRFGVALTGNGIYVIGGLNNSGYFADVEFATINNLTVPDYLHLGDETINISGNYARNYTDLSYKAQGFNIELSRTYNSQDIRPNNIISLGWSFGFQGNIDISGNSAIVRLPQGNGCTFQINVNGSYTALDSRNTLVKNADDTYTLTTKDQYTYGFNSSGYLTWMKDRNGNTITITLNSNRPTHITDQTGRVTTITYNASNKINTITDPAGRIVTYNYNANNELYQVIDPNGNSTYYYYTNDRLTSIKDNTNTAAVEGVTYLPAQGSNAPRVETLTDKFGNITTYSYVDSEGLLIATDTNGRITNTWYEKMGYPIRTRDAEGKETRTEYNLTGGLNKFGEANSFTDRNGNTTFYLRDTRGNVFKQINPDNSTKEYTYDSKNNVLSAKDEMGKYTYYVYDLNSINLLKTVQPLNGTDVYGIAPDENFAITENTYYSDYGTNQIKGLLNTVTDPEGGVTTYTYDSYGSIVTVVSPTSKTTTYSYNKLGWLKSVTTPKGFATSYYYDKAGNLLRQENPDGGKIRNVYDFRNNVTQKIMPTQYIASADTVVTFDMENIQSSASSTYSQTTQGHVYTYFNNGLLQMLTDPCNNQTQYTYDLYGNMLTETKPNGAIYTYTYTLMNQLDVTSFKESSNAAVVLLKDNDYAILENGNTTTTITQHFDDTNTAITTTTFDYAGRQIRLDQADGFFTTNTYNANGTLASSTDARGNTTYYQYDGLNRQIHKWSPVDANAFAFSSTTYDKAGRVVTSSAAKDTVTNGAVPTTNLVSISYSYYADGKVQEELRSSGSKTTYEYDDDGNLKDKYVYSDATNATHEAYTYNNIEKLETKSVTVQKQDITGYDDSTDELTLTAAYTYDKNGNVLTLTNEDDVTTTNTYDAMNRLLTVSQLGVDENNTDVTITASMTYDWAGKVWTATDALNRVTTNTYDKQENLIKVTDALDGVKYFVYDRTGRMIAEVSPNNYASGADLEDMSRTEYSYNDMGRVLLVTQVYYDIETSNWKTFVSSANTYDGNGNITKSQDALGYQNNYGTLFEYDYANRVTKMTDPECQLASLPHTTLYTYDAIGRGLTKTDANNVVTANIYDDNGKVLTTTIGGVLILTNTYDLKGNIQTSTDGNGNTTTYIYNNLNKERSITLPSDGNVASNTVIYKYTKLGQIAESVNSIGKQQVITYDNQGRVLTTTEQKKDETQAITTTSRYDKAGNMRFSTDGNGNTTEYTYDDMNRVHAQIVTVTDVEDNTTTQTTTFTYDANGNKLTEQNWRGNMYTYTYDKLNRLVLKTDPNDKTIDKLEYDNNNAQISSIDALNNKTQYKYDRNNRLTQTIDAMNHSTYQYYDGVGNVIRSVDGNSNETINTYDGFNRLKEVENALNEITAYTYDANSNMLTQTDGKGNITTVKYNCRNLPIYRVDNGGVGQDGTITDYTKAVSYSYYSDGSINMMTDKNGITTTYEYDIHGRTLTVDAGDNTISYTYDDNGNTLTMTDSTGTTTRVYDQLARTISKTISGVGTSTFLYDVAANMPTGCIGEITTDAKGNENTKIFDKAGRLYQIITGSDTTTYTYFDNGNRQSLTYPNGITTEYLYYADNRLQTLANKNGSTIINVYTYSYDGNGNLLTKLDIDGTTSYTYDVTNRLESVTDPGGKVTEYTFDAAGNRETQEVTDGNSIKLTEYTYNAQNHLTSTEEIVGDTTNTVCYSYDNNGNTISSREETLTAGSGTPSLELSIAGEGDAVKSVFSVNTYDALNQLTSANDNDSKSSYVYNGDGLRVGKTVTKDGTTTTTKFVYEYDKVVLELDGSGNQTAYNVYGGDTLISRTSDSTTLYYLYNGHGDVVNLTDSYGTVVMSYDYDPFGNVITATGSIQNSYLYAGYVFDEESGMYYLNARYYDPVVGRFISADTYLGQSNDPLSLNLYTYCKNSPPLYSLLGDISSSRSVMNPYSLNLYAYCSNNPLKYIDPTGHWQQGDSDRDPDSQAKLIALSNAYVNAKSDEEREAIHKQADEVRENSGTKDQDTLVDLSTVNPIGTYLDSIIASGQYISQNDLSTAQNGITKITVKEGTSPVPVPSTTVAITTTTTTFGKVDMAVTGTTVKGTNDVSGSASITETAHYSAYYFYGPDFNDSTEIQHNLQEMASALGVDVSDIGTVGFFDWNSFVDSWNSIGKNDKVKGMTINAHGNSNYLDLGNDSDILPYDNIVSSLQPKSIDKLVILSCAVGGGNQSSNPAAGFANVIKGGKVLASTITVLEAQLYKYGLTSSYAGDWFIYQKINGKITYESTLNIFSRELFKTLGVLFDKL